MKHFLYSMMAAAIMLPAIASAQTSYDQNTSVSAFLPPLLPNTALGINALNTTTTGANNTAIGLMSLTSNTSGNHNAAMGHFSLMSNTTGMYNTAYGMNALRFNTTGGFNTANGSTALYNNTTGLDNTANGFESMRQNTGGSFNTANGYWALYNNTTGNNNTAEGYQAMFNNTIGEGNTACGRLALQANVTGNLNTALGHGADVSLPALNNASAIGANAIVTQSNRMILGDNRVFVGIGLSTDPAGPQNKLEIDAGLNGMLPSLAGFGGLSGLRFRDLHSGNTPSPSNGLALSVDANGDVILVPAAGGGGGLGGICPSGNMLGADYEIPLNNFNLNITTPAFSSNGQVIIGHPANSCLSFNSRLHVHDDFLGEGIYGYSATTWGSNMVGVHGNAFNSTGSTFVAAIGVMGETNGYSTATPTEYYAGVAGFTGTPSFASMPAGQAVAIYGNGINNWGTWAGYFDGDVMINGSVTASGQTAPAPPPPGPAALTVNGNAVTMAGAWYIASDKRYKQDIKKMENVSEKLGRLNGYTYKFSEVIFKDKSNWNTKGQLGFIAQEMQEVFPELVMQNKDGYLAVNYQGLVPVLVEGFKEQQATIAAQQQQIEELKALVHSMAGTAISKNAVSLSDKNTIVLNQNTPNPFAESTVITYSIPAEFSMAQILFTTSDGKLIKAVDITTGGEGSLNVFANDLSSGMYIYTLMVDGKTIDTKRMVKQ
jgi:trimeric autotransporter adhesin